MGVGKTTVCEILNQKLDKSVFLDGDWCWRSNPFQVTEETKKMVVENICFLLNQFINCSAYENIIFCWVMHKQEVIDNIVSKLNLENCRIKIISLVCDPKELIKRLNKDILRSLGQMYVNNEEFRNNIDKFGGKGTANFVSKAIEFYCTK